MVLKTSNQRIIRWFHENLFLHRITTGEHMRDPKNNALVSGPASLYRTPGSLPSQNRAARGFVKSPEPFDVVTKDSVVNQKVVRLLERRGKTISDVQSVRPSSERIIFITYTVTVFVIVKRIFCCSNYRYHGPESVHTAMRSGVTPFTSLQCRLSLHWFSLALCTSVVMYIM